MEFKEQMILQIASFLMGGVASKILDFAFGKKKSDAETDTIVSDNWKAYAEKIEHQLEKVRIDYEALGAKYFAVLTEFQELKIQMLKYQSHSNHESIKNN